ncbi:MAG: NAD(+)/NADH kinase [Micrococcales bacterium]|nr:NAD(+)/NADH kinase [Micrococcales bacterium]
MSGTTWALVAAVVAAVVLLVALVVRRRPVAAPSAAGPQTRSGPWVPRIAFVVNPSKPDGDAVRSQLLAACAERGLPDPLWLTTTVADPGGGQARAALKAGADVVVAVGGDGTVRAVAEVMVGSGVPMGLVPTGTGNLLARNVDVPVGDPAGALRAVVDGRDKTVDVGRLRVERRDAADWGPEEHMFVAIAGLGFDGALVADTDDDLKARVGWVAYFLAGFRHLHGTRHQVRVTRDDGEPQTAWVRSAMIGNCGRLPGGIVLLPDALLDDGLLDVAVVDTRGGLAGWAQLLGEVVLQGAGMRTALPAKIGRIDHAQARRIHLEVTGSATLQVDGDLVGDVTALTAWVGPGALLLRVP